jgi:hypothetical protein
MQDRSERQIIFRPQEDAGQRIAIGGASVRSAALPFGKYVQFWASKACWIAIGDNAVIATQAIDVPLPAGGVFEYRATGSEDQFIAVVEDAAEAAVTGFFFIGQVEE